MRIIEEYNASATKQMLYRVMNKYCMAGTERKVSWGDIYDVLRFETQPFTPYHTGDGHFLAGYTFPLIHPQGDEGRGKAGVLLAYCKNKFPMGSIFRFYSNGQDDKCSMMINVTTQPQAVSMVRYLLFKAKSLIDGIEFYAVETAGGGMPLRCDKVVIYYDGIHEDAIYNYVVEGARKFSCVFKRDLNGFVHVWGDEQSLYPVGIGVQWRGRSITEWMAQSVFKELTGRDADNNKPREAWAVLEASYSEGYMDAVFNKVISVSGRIVRGTGE